MAVGIDAVSQVGVIPHHLVSRAKRQLPYPVWRLYSACAAHGERVSKTSIRLDEVDRRILAVLTHDAGLTNKDLANRLGLAPSTCLSRVRRLEQHRIIVGYRAVVARTGPGARVEGWADIRFTNLTPDLNRDFIRIVEAAPEIIEAHRIAGRSDFVVRFSAGDMSAWTSFREKLDRLGGLVEAHLSVLVEAVK